LGRVGENKESFTKISDVKKYYFKFKKCFKNEFLTGLSAAQNSWLTGVM
jgi:hypothetical protein